MLPLAEKNMTKTNNPPVPLYHPLNTLKPVGKDIWLVDGGIINMDVKIAKLPFSTRMTIVRLAGGDLWCHSPIAPDEELKVIQQYWPGSPKKLFLPTAAATLKMLWQNCSAPFAGLSS